MPDAGALALRALEEAFDTARALDGRTRERWLAERERHDPALVRELRSLLAADAEVGALDRLAPRLHSVRGVVEREVVGLVDHRTLPLPTRAGPYVVTGEIGHGAMGVVCRAHDTRLGRDVALKIFPRALADMGPSESRVLAEARAASALDHPHICTIHDVGLLDDGRPYLAMAYYAGGTLAERIARGPLTVRDAVDVALQLAHALSCAHAAGIIHRDVKPRNVVFAERGVAKLLDFGVATLRDEAIAGASAGTPAYMAPEQVRGEAVDGRADVWALGVVLYEMLTGRRPFMATNRAAIRRAILFETPMPVRSLRREVPRKVAALVARLLARSHGARPDAATAARELRGMLAAMDDREPSPFGWLARRRGTLVALAGGLFASSGAAPDRVPRDERYDRARGLLEAGAMENVEAAIVLLRAVTRSAPDHALAHGQLAVAFLRAVEPGGGREGQVVWVDSAFAHARHAVAIAPGEPEPHTVLGMLYAHRGQHAEAAAAHLRALDLDPGNARAMLNLSHSAMALDRFGDAFVWMERALAKDPALPGARLRAVSRYASWEMVPEALRHVDAGLARSPTDTELMWQRIMIELRAGDTSRARRHLDQYLTLVSEAERVRLSGWFEFLRGDFAAARRHVDRVADVSSASYDRKMYGTVFMLTGDRVRGEPMLRQALAAARAEDRRLGHRSEHAAFELANLHVALGDTDAALRELARWDALGGVAARQTFARFPTWRPLLDDSRFAVIIDRADARFRAHRARIVERLTADG
ncbi:MAG TPA: protein kinase [Gemmatimonadaceae bacterium]|nr:protein kinase [Gemmatimonadaceae bacterium]